MDEPIEEEEDDDDEFRDDDADSTSPEQPKPTRQRAAASQGRLVLRRSKVSEESDFDDEDERAWEATPTARRTRSGRALGSIVGSAADGSDYELESDVRRPRRQLRTQSKSTRRGTSSASLSFSELQDEELIAESGKLAPRLGSTRNSSKKNSARVIATSSESDGEGGVDENGEEEVQLPLQHQHKQLNSSDTVGDDQNEGNSTTHRENTATEASVDPHGHGHPDANDLTSNDQSPETPQVISMEEQAHAVPADAQHQRRHYQDQHLNINGVPKINGFAEAHGPPHWIHVHAQANMGMGQNNNFGDYSDYSNSQDPVQDFFGMESVEVEGPNSTKSMRPSPAFVDRIGAYALNAFTDPTSALTPEKQEEDAVMAEVLGNPGSEDSARQSVDATENLDDMEMCDEDAEGEDEIDTGNYV
jgi:hypothetical protein